MAVKVFVSCPCSLAKDAASDPSCLWLAGEGCSLWSMLFSYSLSQAEVKYCLSDNSVCLKVQIWNDTYQSANILPKVRFTSVLSILTKVIHMALTTSRGQGSFKFSHAQNERGCLRDGSVVKSVCYSFRAPAPISQPPVTAAPGVRHSLLATVTCTPVHIPTHRITCMYTLRN